MRAESPSGPPSTLTSLPAELLAWLEQRHGSGSAAGAQVVVRAGEDRGRALAQQIVQLPATFDGPQQYAIRIAAPHGDWIARATGDERLREVRLREALGRSLPVPLRMAILDALPLDDGRVLLIEPPLRSLTGDQQAQSQAAVRALARLHSGCATFPARLTATLGLVPLGAWLTLYAPQTGVREAALVPDDAAVADDIPSRLQPGWEAFAEHAPDAWQVLAPLLSDPAPLVRALRACPETLLNGSPSIATVHVGGTGADASSPVLLHDWRQALRAPGALDLAAFLASASIESDRPTLNYDDLIETYRVARADGGRLPASGERWERELALALFANAMRVGWALAGDGAHTDTDDAALRFWSDAALAGAAVLQADAERAVDVEVGG